jgi:hypothetical protein
MKPRPAHFTSFLSAFEKLGPHDHLCSIYDSDQEHLAVATRKGENYASTSIAVAIDSLCRADGGL